MLSLPLGDDDGYHLAQAPFPTVALDTCHPALSAVVIDDVGGGRAAANYMLSLGHRRIAFLGRATPQPVRLRLELEARGRLPGRAAVPPASAGAILSRHAPHRRAAARHQALELLRLLDRPTAIVASSDIQAIGVLDAAREFGIDVPGELSVTGYDDIDLAAHLDISTIRQPLAYSGERSADILLDALANPTDSAGARRGARRRGHRPRHHRPTPGPPPPADLRLTPPAALSAAVSP